MSDGSFAQHIQSERERLSRERERIFNQQEELQKKLDEINREFQAIEAYESAKTGKAARPASGRGASGPQRTRRGSKREGILQAIKNATGGLTRGELLQAMGLKGDKSGEMSVSNALTALTKSSQVRRDGGKYHAA
jgi:hypothetical protein